MDIINRKNGLTHWWIQNLAEYENTVDSVENEVWLEEVILWECPSSWLPWNE